MTSVVVLVAELLGHLEASVGVLFQEAQKVLALDEVYLAGIDSLRCQLIGFAGNSGAEPKDFAGFSDLEDHRLAVGGTDGEFHLALAEHENTARDLVLDKQHRALGIGGGILDGFKGLRGGGIKVTKNPVSPHLAGKTAFDDVESVW